MKIIIAPGSVHSFDEHAVLRNLEDAVETAENAGFVVTVEQSPLQPLAMGHYETVVTISPAHGES